jgi:hypothetical protein
MVRRIAEPELIVPTLMLLYESPNGEMKTTDLISSLMHYFLPGGEDTEILDNRNDTKFSQKVRNLKSHKTLEKADLAEHTADGFRITAKGRLLVESLG